MRRLRCVVHGRLRHIAFFDSEALALRGLDIGAIKDPAHLIKAIGFIENLVSILTEELLKIGWLLIIVAVYILYLLLIVQLSDQVIELGLLEAEVLHKGVEDRTDREYVR